MFLRIFSITSQPKLSIFSASGSFLTKKVERTLGEVDSQRRNPLKLTMALISIDVREVTKSYLRVS